MRYFLKYIKKQVVTHSTSSHLNHHWSLDCLISVHVWPHQPSLTCPFLNLSIVFKVPSSSESSTPSASNTSAWSIAQPSEQNNRSSKPVIYFPLLHHGLEQKMKTIHTKIDHLRDFNHSQHFQPAFIFVSRIIESMRKHLGKPVSRAKTLPWSFP
jgi:hypothetical protein